MYLYLSVYFQVRELHQGVLGKLQQLHPRLLTQGTAGEGYRRIRMEVEREAARRKTLGSQLKSLLDSQLEVCITHHFFPSLLRIKLS